MSLLIEQCRPPRMLGLLWSNGCIGVVELFEASLIALLVGVMKLSERQASAGSTITLFIDLTFFAIHKIAEKDIFLCGVSCSDSQVEREAGDFTWLAMTREQTWTNRCPVLRLRHYPLIPPPYLLG